MEAELVSEKDVLLLHTGFLKYIFDHIIYHLLISVDGNTIFILKKIINLELREQDSEDVAVVSKEWSAEA